MTALFSQPVENTTSTLGQAAMRAKNAALPAEKYAVEKALQDAYQGLRAPGETAVSPGTTAEFANVMEGGIGAPSWAQPGNVTAPVADAAAGARALLDEQYAQRYALGQDIKYREDYLPAQMLPVNPGGPQGAGFGKNPYSAGTPSLKGRDAGLFGDLPHQGWLNPLTANPEAAVPGWSQMDPAARAQGLLQNVLYEHEAARAAAGKAGVQGPAAQMGQRAGALGFQDIGKLK